MNITEANATNTLIRYWLGLERENGDLSVPVTEEQAREAAGILADQAHKALHAGLTGDTVRFHWPERVS